jgi:hypothetical protein
LALLALAALQVPVLMPVRVAAILGSTKQPTQPPPPQQTALLPRAAQPRLAALLVDLVAMLGLALVPPNILAAMVASKPSRK